MTLQLLQIFFTDDLTFMYYAFFEKSR